MRYERQDECASPDRISSHKQGYIKVLSVNNGVVDDNEKGYQKCESATVLFGEKGKEQEERTEYQSTPCFPGVRYTEDKLQYKTQSNEFEDNNRVVVPRPKIEERVGDDEKQNASQPQSVLHLE